MAVNVEIAGAEAPPGTDVPAAVRDGRARYLAAVLAALAGAWLVPLLTHLLAVDWVLPVLLWFGVAALLRSGRSVLDRLMIGAGILLAAVPTAGLLISVWPWGLAPVPAAGFGFTVLVAVAAMLRRVPRLPLAVRGVDLVTIGLGLAALVAVFWPYRHADKTGRFALIAAGGDLASHFSLYDAMREVGGYVFMHRPQTAGEVWSIYQTYPQGLHFTGALLASFLRSDGHQAASAVTELNTFVWFEPVSFVFMVLAILWAARWLAGPGLRAWAWLPAGTLGAMYLLFGDPLEMLWSGYWPEIAGLAEFAILLAVLARPLSRIREQIVLVVALLVAISYTYFLTLPIAGAATLVWLVVYRRRLRGHATFLAVAGLAGVASAGVMLYVNLIAFPAGDHLTVPGSILHPNNRVLLCVASLVFAATVGAAWRSPAWRGYLVSYVVTVGLILAVAMYHEYKLGHLDYFYYKSTHLLMIVSVLGLGSVARVLGTVVTRPARSGPPLGRLLGQVWPAVPSAALSIAAVAALGPFLSPGWSRSYEDGKLAWRWPAESALRVAAALPQRTGAVVLVWPGRGVPAHATHWSNVLLRDHGHGWQAQMWIATGQTLEQLFDASPYPVRVVTDNGDIIAQVNAILDRRPDLRAKVTIAIIALPA